jgi:peptidoglycan hydrolase CwlO-like protein
MPDIDLQKLISDNDKKNIRRILIAIVITILLCVLVVIILSHRQDNNAAQYNRSLQDSIRVHDRIYKEQLKNLQTTHDSAISAIQEQQDNLQEQMTSIQNHYDKVRKQLTNSSVDNRVKFFSDHISPRK